MTSPVSRAPPSPASPRLPWAPFYTIHKIMAGMLDMYQLAGNRQALQVLEGMAGWADQWTASKSEEHMQQILGTEYGGMAEMLYNLAAITNNDQWAKAGDRFTKKWFFNPLAMRRDELSPAAPARQHPHPASHRRRAPLRNLRRHALPRRGRFLLVRSRPPRAAYVTGGTSNGEVWHGQPRELAAELKRQRRHRRMLLRLQHAEAHAPPLRLDRRSALLRLLRAPHAQPPPRHHSSPTRATRSITSRSRRAPGRPSTPRTIRFWCCTGTGVEEYSKLNDSIYWHDGDGLYVNLFIPSELNWSEKGLKLRQETKFPEQQSTTLTVTAEKPVAMPVRLRIPAWLDSAPTVKINGRALEASAAPGSYLTITRTWKTGDRVEMALPMRLRVEAMPDDPHMQAVPLWPAGACRRSRHGGTDRAEHDWP